MKNSNGYFIILTWMCMNYQKPKISADFFLLMIDCTGFKDMKDKMENKSLVDDDVKDFL